MGDRMVRTRRRLDAAAARGPSLLASPLELGLIDASEASQNFIKADGPRRCWGRPGKIACN